MNYSVISVVNGNFKIEAEYGKNLQEALVFFHTKCSTLWSAEDVKEAVVEIVDNNLNVVNDKTERIFHPINEPEDPDNADVVDE